MRTLTILIIVLMCTTLYSQEYKEFRTIGIVETETKYNSETNRTKEKTNSYNTIISFVILSHDNTETKTMRIYIDDGSIEVVMELFIIEKISESEEKDYITYILYSKITGPINVSYNEKNFSMAYKFKELSDGESRYISRYNGSIMVQQDYVIKPNT